MMVSFGSIVEDWFEFFGFIPLVLILYLGLVLGGIMSIIETNLIWLLLFPSILISYWVLEYLFLNLFERKPQWKKSIRGFFSNIGSKLWKFFSQVGVGVLSLLCIGSVGFTFWGFYKLVKATIGYFGKCFYCGCCGVTVLVLLYIWGGVIRKIMKWIETPKKKGRKGR